MKKRLNPLNDYLFQKYLGEKGDEEQLMSFLNAVLRRTRKARIVELEILENKTLTADIIGDKASILDVRAVTDTGTKVNVEVQLRNVGNMDRRSLFYWSREYAKGIEAGQDYIELPNVIAINIVDFEFIPINDYHTSFHLWEDVHKDYMLTDALEIHFVDMVKFKKFADKDIKNNPLHRWLTFFDKDVPDDVLKEVLSMEAAILKANEKIEHVSKDRDAMRLYEMREMGMSDMTSAINSAVARGRDGGLKEIAKNALRKGYDIAEIADITGLDESAIRELQTEMFDD